MDLFNIQIGMFYSRSHDLPVSKRPDLVDIDSCECLSIEEDDPMENDELTRLLENIKISRMLYVKMPINPGFYCDPKKFKGERLDLRNFSGGWIDRNFLFNLGAKNIQLRNCDVSKINARDVEDFIDRWYQSDDNKFTFLIMTWTQNPGQVDLLKFNAHDWDEKRRGQFFRFHAKSKMNLARGRDIIRSDGLIGTVYTGMRDTLVFCVWHDRFPNVDGLADC